MRRAIAAWAASLVIGCGYGPAEVVRIYDGRPRVERFVNDRAYAASLEAAIAEERADWPAAVTALTRARDEDPEAPDLDARLGLALCHLQKFDEARLAFDRAMRFGDQRARAFTARARCALLRSDTNAARADLSQALADDPEALEPALLLVDLDLRSNELHAARARIEEAVVLHPSSASAERVLAEVLVRAGDLAGAVEAATAASRLDEQEGARARAAVIALADRSAIASYALAMRKQRAQPATAFAAEMDARCTKLLEALRVVATTGRAEEVFAMGEGVRASCPDIEPEAALVQLEAEWSPATSEAVEARALSTTSSSARRWAQRMRLRRLPLDALLARDTLPRAEDEATLALQLAATALREAREEKKETTTDAAALAGVARSLALAEPTVARIVAEVARLTGKKADDAWRRTACDLARTDVEKQACS